MQRKKKLQSTLPSVLATLLKLTYSYSFRKVLLYPEKKPQPPKKIRLYDSQRDALESIASIIKSPMERKKMVTFFEIKNKTEPKGEERQPFRANSTHQKLKRQRSGNRSGVISESKAFSSSSKENELRDIFSRVKVLASNLIYEKNPSEDFAAKTCPSSILSQITQLEHDMTQLAEGDKMMSTTMSTSSSKPSGWKKALKLQP